jgi:hypothetical protein
VTGLLLVAHAIAQVDAAVRGIHVLWSGPVGWGYAPSGYLVERRTQIPRPQWQCVALDAAGLTRLRHDAEIASVLGPIRVHAGAAPVTLPAGAPPAPGAWEVLTVELVIASDAVRVVVNAKWSQAVAFAGGKAVAASPLTKGALVWEATASQIDAVRVYAQGLGDARVCADRSGPESWSDATTVATLQLPLVELDPALGGPAGELDLARKRLVPGETMAAGELADGLELIRALVTGRVARPIDHTLLVEDDPVDGERVQPTELSGLDPLRALLASPRWRRVLGLAYCDRDPALVIGTRYQYRVRASFPALERDDRVLGFHTVPSQTLLPAKLALAGAQVRLAQPAAVVLTRASQGPGVTVARRAIRVDDAGAPGPWWAPALDGWAIVIDLPAPARSIDLELEGSHELRLWAGAGDSVISDGAVPPGASPRIDFPVPVDQLRIAGRGLLCAIRARPAVPPPGVAELAAPTPAVVFDATPPPLPPLSIAVTNVQTGAAARKPSELGFDVTWLPAPIGGVTAWPPDLAPPPGDAAFFQIERRLEPAGDWRAVTERDNLIGGGRDTAPLPAALSPGAEVMDVFPEAAAPAGTQLLARWRDTFEPIATADRPAPGTVHRYRIRSVDGIGRPSTAWTIGEPVMLEKRRPPPPPGTLDARALVAGAPDLTAADLATLAGHANALVVRCRWADEERALDPYARELRFYCARLRLDAIAGAATAVTALGGGFYQVSWLLAEPVAANASAGLRLTGGYPFAITQHTAGAAIAAVLRAAVPDDNGSYPVPVVGPTWFPVRALAERRRPRRFGARVAVQALDARTDYAAVFHDVFFLAPDHPIDRLLVGVSAADDQRYVPDDLFPADNRPGNESALATTVATARDASQPVLGEAPALVPVPAIDTPVPRAGDLRATLDLTALVAGLGLPPGPVRLERARDTAIARAYRIAGGQVIATPPEPAQPGEVEAPIAIANPADRAAILAALGGADLGALADHYLVYLAASHPYRGRLFEPSHERAVLPIIDDTWPPFGARWVYRARGLDAAGRVSADGRTLRGVVRVPTPVAPPAPYHHASGPAPALELRFAAAAGVDRLLVFAVDAGAAAAGAAPALVARSEAGGGAAHALRLADATLVGPTLVIAAAATAVDAGERVAAVVFAAPAGLTLRVWACTVSPAGVASSLAGPWLWRTPPAPPPLPALTVTRVAEGVRAAWTWPAGATDLPMLFVEAAAGQRELARVSPRLAPTVTSYDLPATTTRVRLVVRGDAGTLVAGPVSEAPWPS